MPEPRRAEDEAGRSRRQGRERLLAALRRPVSRGQLTVAVVLALVGFASVVQVRANDRDSEYAGLRQPDLIQLLNSLAAASQRAENEVAELEDTRRSLLDSTQRRQVALEQARSQALVLNILAGTVPAIGPGVSVTVRDPSGQVGTDELLNGLEELRDAGAEAIELNDRVRVVAQTSLRDGNGGVVADGVLLEPPYQLEAIGAPDTLAQALGITGGFTDGVENPAIGGTVHVSQLDRVSIASIREPLEPSFATPVPQS